TQNPSITGFAYACVAASLSGPAPTESWVVCLNQKTKNPVTPPDVFLTTQDLGSFPDLRGRDGGPAGSGVPTARQHRQVSWRVPSDLANAPVDEELDAGDEAGVAGREKERRGRNLFGPADGAARDHGDKAFLRVLGEAIEDRGVDRTRTDHVHAD